jgi:hypothetical protein
MAGRLVRIHYSERLMISFMISLVPLCILLTRDSRCVRRKQPRLVTRVAD